MSKNCDISSVKEIMEKMGFNKDAPIETQKAFLKHLLGKSNFKVKKIKVKSVVQEQLDLFKKAS